MTSEGSLEPSWVIPETIVSIEALDTGEGNEPECYVTMSLRSRLINARVAESAESLRGRLEAHFHEPARFLGGVGFA